MTRSRAASTAAGVFGWLAPAAMALAATALAVVVFAAEPAAGLLVGIAAGRVFRGALAIVRVSDTAAAPAPPGVAAEPDAAWLGGLVWRAARAVGAPAPGVVRITLGCDVGLHREGRRSVLTVGACWLTAGSAAELTVAIAHALAHERAGAGGRMRVLDERLRRAGNLVARGRWRRAVWGGYLRRGRALAARAQALQQHSADLACASAFGLPALDAYLRAAFRHERFDEYWSGDVEPCLAAGFAPPILAGWSSLLGQGWFRDDLAEGLAAAHLTRRSEAVRAWAPSDAPISTWPDGLPAIGAGVAKLERRLLAATYPHAASGTLVDLAWETVGTAVWLPRLRDQLAAVRASIVPFEAGDLPATVAAADASGGVTQVTDAPDQSEASGRTGPRPEAFAAALAVALVDAGWTLEVRLGQPLELRRGELSLDPFALCRASAAGSVDGAAWDEFAEEAAIADLAVPAPDEAPAAAVAPPDEWLLGVAVPAHRAVLTLAGPPAGAPARIRLATGLGLPAGAALVFAASRAPTTAGVVVVGVFGAIVLGACAALIAMRTRLARATGTLTVTGDGLRLEHPGLLKVPFELARPNVRAVFIDDRPPGATRFALTATAFPAGAAPRAGFLWVRGQTPVVPSLTVAGQDPNVALLLEEPVLAPGVRHMTANGPMPGEALTGLLLCVCGGAEAARAAFVPWGCVRPPLQLDAAHIGRGYFGGAASTRASAAPPDTDQHG